MQAKTIREDSPTPARGGGGGKRLSLTGTGSGAARRVGSVIVVALTAAVGLAACSGGSAVSPGGDPAALEAARMELAELRALLLGPEPSADPGARDEALMRTSAVIAEARAATVRAGEALAAAAVVPEKTAAALTRTSEALRLTGEALDEARAALTANHHGNPLEDANLALSRAQDAIDEAQGAMEEGTADILRSAEVALAQARAALTPLTSDRLEQLREQLAAATSDLAKASADLDAADQLAARQRARAEAAEREAAAEKSRADAAEAARNAANDEAARQKTRADNAEDDAAAQKSRADAAGNDRDAARNDAAAQKARADNAEGERDEARNDLATHGDLALPEGLDATLTAGAFTIAAGGSATRDGVEFRCPDGGAACRVQVSAGGAIAWWDARPTLWPFPARSALHGELRPAESLTAAERAARSVGSTTLAVERFRRLNAANDGPAPEADRLAIATDGVPWDADKAIVKPTGELPLRAITFRGNGYVQGAIVGLDGTTDTGRRSDGFEYLTTRWYNTQAEVASSIELTEDGGAILKVGGNAGEGLLYGDMKIDPDLGSSFGPDGAFRGGDDCTPAMTNAGTCYDANRADLKITFGRSSSDPSGAAAVRWTARVPFAGDPADVARKDYPLPCAVDPVCLVNPGAGAVPQTRDYHDHGSYELLISRYAGLDAGADANSPDDDTHRYLEYAAYGLFHFLDAQDDRIGSGRVQAFHFGYDAFRDADDHRPTDISTAIDATFTGVTHGWDMRDSGEWNARYRLDFAPGDKVGALVPIRGDVSLTAKIGGAGSYPATNYIRGEITGFEFYHPGSDEWYHYHGNDITTVYLVGASAGNTTGAEIMANGSFRGVAAAAIQTGTGNPDSAKWGHRTDSLDDYIQHGEYRGMLYGPRNAPEAAGWWRIVPDDRTAGESIRSLGMTGAFGARCTDGCR